MTAIIRRFGAVLALVCTGMAPAAAQQQGLSKEQVAAIEKEVAAALHNYYSLYTEKNNKALSADVFLDTWIQLGANGPTITGTDPADVAKRFAANIERLQAQGWVKSAYPNPIICVINASTAIASGEFMRYRADGSVLSYNATSYLFTKTPKGWRIASFFGHERGKIIGCNDGV